MTSTMSTSRTTSSGETITTTEVERQHFIGRSRGHNNGATWVIGPVLVDVVQFAHVSDKRPMIEDTYSIEIDGRHQCGGPARLLAADATPRFVDVEPLD